MIIKRRILCLTVIVTLLSSAVFCTCAVYASSVDYAAEGSECFRFLEAVGVISSGEKYSAGTVVTRGRFVHLSIGLSGMNADSLTSSDSGFSDVPPAHSYAQAITHAKKLGYISGSTSDYFNPDIPVTSEQAAKILCDILGYSHIAKSYGGYPSGYVRTASDIGLFDGTSLPAAGELSMSDAVIMISNAANAEVMTISSMGDSIEYETKKDYTVLAERMDIELSEGILTANECTDLYAPDSGLDFDTVALDTLKLSAGSSDISDYVGYSVKVYYKESGGRYPEVLYYSLSEENNTISCDTDSLYMDKGYLTYEADENSFKRINVKSDASYIVNGKMTSFRYSELPAIEKGNVTFVSNDGDNTMDVVYVTIYETYVVSGVSVTSNRIAAEDGSFIELDPDNCDYVFEIYKDNTASSLSAIIPGNIVLLAESSGEGINKKAVFVSDRVAAGELEEKGEDTVVVGGIEYKIGETLLNQVTAGKKYEFFIDYFGEIVNFKNSRSSVYGYLFGLSINKFGEVKCKIYSENKHWVELEFKDRLKFNGEPMPESDVYAELETKSGKYRDIIRYNVNSDNEVINIETAADMTAYSLISDEARDAADSGVFRKSYSGSHVWRGRSNSFDGKICLNSDCVIFFIPEDGDEDEIRVMKPGALPSDDGYDFVAYDVDKGLNASVIKVSKLPMGGGSSSNFFFVKSKGEALDAEGDTVPSLRGYWRGFEISVQVELSSSLTQADYDSLKAGMPILFSLNDEGKIEKFINCTPDSDGYYSGPAGRGAYYTSSCQAGGKVIRNDYTNGHLVVEASASGDYYNTQYGSETMVFIYNKTTGEYTEGSVADIVPGDVIVSKLMYFFSNEIAVIRE